MGIGFTSSDVRAMTNAINMIAEGRAKRVDLGMDTTVYKVPSNNPNKFTIRVDIKVKKEE